MNVWSIRQRTLAINISSDSLKPTSCLDICAVVIAESATRAKEVAELAFKVVPYPLADEPPVTVQLGSASIAFTRPQVITVGVDLSPRPESR